MGQWIDSDGDGWDRMCSYCTHRHDFNGGMLFECRRQEKKAFQQYIGRSGDNGCPDFHTSDKIG